MKKITAIIRNERLEPVEQALIGVGTEGVSVSQVKGYGEYANFFARDWVVTHSKIEIFTSEAHSRAIVNAILQAAQTGAAGDGVIAVQHADAVVRVRNGHAVDNNQHRQEDSAGVNCGEPPRDEKRSLGLLAILRWTASVMVVLALLAAVMVSARHREHFLAAALAGAFILYVGLGLLSLLSSSPRPPRDT